MNILVGAARSKRRATRSQLPAYRHQRQTIHPDPEKTLGVPETEYVRKAAADVSETERTKENYSARGALRVHGRGGRPARKMRNSYDPRILRQRI